MNENYADLNVKAPERNSSLPLVLSYFARSRRVGGLIVCIMVITVLSLVVSVGGPLSLNYSLSTLAAYNKSPLTRSRCCNALTGVSRNGQCVLLKNYCTDQLKAQWYVSMYDFLIIKMHYCISYVWSFCGSSQHNLAPFEVFCFCRAEQKKKAQICPLRLYNL